MLHYYNYHYYSFKFMFIALVIFVYICAIRSKLFSVINSVRNVTTYELKFYYIES